MDPNRDPETVPVPRAARFPVELRLPSTFAADRLETWPRVDGRLEFVGGRLWYMPPSGDTQQFVAVDVAFTLRAWAQQHPEFVVGGNEAGIIFGTGEIRAADVAVWNVERVGSLSGGFQRSRPVLAVEVAGRDEDEAQLRQKALWYLARGVRVVWLVLPTDRSCVAMRPGTEDRISAGGSIPAVPELPGLTPSVDTFFAQLNVLGGDPKAP